MSANDIQFLKKVGLFTGLDQNLLSLIGEITEEIYYSKNEIIFHEGDAGKGLFFIKSGQVKISKISENGREIIVHILGPGDFFAEVTLFQKDSVYPATAEVIEGGVIGYIRNERLEKLVMVNTSLALELIRALTGKLISIQERIKHLGTNDAVERTMQVLIALSGSHGRKSKDGIELCVNITRQDLAAFVGTTRETISRILSKFNQAGIIDISGKNIIIKDLDGLKNWLE